MPDIATDLTDLATDFANKFLDRVDDYADEGKDVLKWAAKEAQKAADKWADDKITDAQFKRWLKDLATIRVPSKLGAIAHRKARAELEFIIGTAFKALSILAGAI